MARETATRTSRLRAGDDESPMRRWLDRLLSPRLAIGTLVSVVFVVAATFLAIWSRDQSLVAVGRVMDETRIVRVKIELEDRAATDQARQAARQATPYVYAASGPYLDEIEASLANLPKTLAPIAEFAAVDKGIVEQFGLTDELYKAVRAEAVNGEASPAWRKNVSKLMELLRRRPLLDEQTWQRSSQEGTHTTIRLILAQGSGEEVREIPGIRRTEVLNAGSKEQVQEAMSIVARDAGFVGPLRSVVVNRLTKNPQPTYRFDAAATAQAQNAAAAGVPTQFQTSPPGQVIYQRGEVLTQPQNDLLQAETRALNAHADAWRLLMRRGALAAAVAGIALANVGYVILFCPMIRRSPGRMTSLAAILLFSLAAGCATSAWYPEAAAVTTVVPSIFVALIIGIGYDRRAALAFGLLHGLLLCICLRETIGTMATIVSGIACVVISIADIRDRASLVRLTVTAALGVGFATIITSIIERPILIGSGVEPRLDTGLKVLRETFLDASWAAFGTAVLGGATLFVLPAIERAFDVATGLTLIELRDPKHPLLRELQVRAPGTYNHSLNVATISETAADAIGANGLLTYVGALYHDVGKMNKPDYFVENQSGGPNKHDKLSPAMSLLVVVGHVKDGLELAREHRLPRAVTHFIESHHGTTLVEFFFHRARKLAEGRTQTGEEDAQVPDEFEYRYPGPKPRSKEAAVLMIADASESATRAMSEPTPARIDALVRNLANKRLLDGQFDDCELTLRELTTIVESVVRTLQSMHHARIEYPAGKAEAPSQTGEFEETKRQMM